MVVVASRRGGEYCLLNVSQQHERGALWVICSDLDISVSAICSHGMVSLARNLVLAVQVQCGQVVVVGFDPR